MPDFKEEDFDFKETDIQKYLKIPDLPYMITYLKKYFKSFDRASKVLKISPSHLCLCCKEKRALNYYFGRKIAAIYLMAHFMEPEEIEKYVNLS